MKYCTKCGHQMADDMLFCQKCGTKSEPIKTEQTAAPQHTEVKAAAPQQSYSAPATTPIKHKPRRVLKGISIFCLFGAALMLLMSIVADSTMFVGALVYGILGVLFLMLSKTPKGSIYLLGKEKGIKKSMFILICIFLLFASVIVFSATQCQHEYVLSATKAATCTEDGTETYTCTLCDHEKSETLKATGHSMQNGKCSVCGYSEAKPESGTTSKPDTTSKENTKTTLSDIEKWYTNQTSAVSQSLMEYAKSIDGLTSLNVDSSKFRFGEDSGWYDCHYTFIFTCKVNGTTYNGEARAFMKYQDNTVNWFHFEIFSNTGVQSLVEHYDDSYDQIIEDYYKELESKYN